MIIENLLSIIIFFPLLGIPLILLLPERRILWSRYVTVGVLLVPLFLSFYLYALYDPASPIRAYSPERSDLMFLENHLWIPSFSIHYLVGVDGLSLPMVLLTTVISLVGALASWSITRYHRGYFSLYLLLYTGMMGVFLALDFFLFYVFWEVMLLPMYFLIGIWGGPRREYAAIKFFLYTLFGSLFMLLVLIAFYFFSDANPDPETTVHTFNLIELTKSGVLQGPFASGYAGLSGDGIRQIAWLFLFLGFAIKIPAFPFHTWLPDAHVEAPTAISVILAGVLLKMGTYGLIRINFPVLPQESVLFAPSLLVGLGVVNIIYGALAAMAQKDLKKLIAYSSVSHMGFVMLGMGSFNTEGLNGALFQMFNHGTITALLFLLVGVIYDRAHHREIERFGGIATYMPVFAAFTAFAFFAGLGLPGLSGFISEALCFMGGFQNHRLATMLAVTGVILGAAYLLRAYQKIFLGTPNETYANFSDINVRETLSLIPAAAFVLVFGIYPVPMLDLMGPTLETIRLSVAPYLI